MAGVVFTKDELNYLKHYLTGEPFRTEGSEPMYEGILLQKLKDIQPGQFYQTYQESVTEDVRILLEEEMEILLSDEEIESIVYRVMKYDDSDYMDFIRMTIEQHMQDK